MANNNPPPLREPLTDKGGIISRAWAAWFVRADALSGGSSRLSKSIAGGAGNTTLTSSESANTILEVTGAITGNRTVTLPLINRQWIVFNNTTGAFTVTFIGATGTGVVVATAKRATLYSDTTNIVRATADV